MQGLAVPVVLLVLLLAAHQAQAFPSIFVARYAKDCLDHPAADFGKVHEYQKSPDRAVSFSLTAASTGKAASGKVCAGDSYSLQVDFGEPSRRNFLLTSTHGSLTNAKNDCDNWCDNRLCSPEPATQAKATFKLPCGTAAGTQVVLRVTSANGRTPTPGSTLRSASLSLQVEGDCPGACKAAASSSTSSTSSGSASKTTSSSPSTSSSSSSSSSSTSTSTSTSTSSSSSPSTGSSSSPPKSDRTITEGGPAVAGSGGGGGGGPASSVKKVNAPIRGKQGA